MRVDTPVGLELLLGTSLLAAVEEDGTIGLGIEVFDDLDKVCTDVVLLRGCPQSCMPHPVELSPDRHSTELSQDAEDDHSILRREVEAAVQLLKKGKSARVNNIPSELVRADGEDVITALTTICSRIWQTGEWPTPWLSLIHI